MQPTTRAFRFIAYGRAFAIDIQNNTVHLLAAVPAGWDAVTEFNTIAATDAAIDAAGGPVKFADLILEAVNVVLRLIGAKPRPDEAPKPREGVAQDAVLAHLALNVRSWEMMDGTFELQVRR